MAIWISIIIATVCIQIPNIWAINKFALEPSFKSAITIGFFTIPASFLASSCYAYFYGMGFSKYSYPLMAISAFAISLIVSFFVQQIILKNKEIIMADYLSITLVLLGLLVMIFRKEINTAIF